jgi:cellulose synthase/poly-beta-1,6-N-acetylglucosamine synthase-like glycosyltransferase
VSGPQVSVLLPVRDEEPCLAECLESFSAQTLSDFEVIAVDALFAGVGLLLIAFAARRVLSSH